MQKEQERTGRWGSFKWGHQDRKKREDLSGISANSNSPDNMNRATSLQRLMLSIIRMQDELAAGILAVQPNRLSIQQIEMNPNRLRVASARKDLHNINWIGQED